MELIKATGHAPAARKISIGYQKGLCCRVFSKLQASQPNLRRAELNKGALASKKPDKYPADHTFRLLTVKTTDGSSATFLRLILHPDAPFERTGANPLILLQPSGPGALGMSLRVFHVANEKSWRGRIDPYGNDLADKITGGHPRGTIKDGNEVPCGSP